jgi:hypothetical protein
MSSAFSERKVGRFHDVAVGRVTSRAREHAAATHMFRPQVQPIALVPVAMASRINLSISVLR